MEAKFKSLSYSAFKARYPDHETCLKRLSDLKWRKGFRCNRCGHDRYCGCGGNTIIARYSRQCTSCHYKESPTANTIFHQVKFPLDKAFEIVYLVVNDRKGCASTELARKLQLRQKTCWLFKRKVMNAMRSDGRSPLTGLVEVGVYELGHRMVELEEGTADANPSAGIGGQPRKPSKKRVKKLTVLAVERRGKGASRLYGGVITASSAAELGRFMSRVIHPEAEVVCNGWSAFRPLQNRFERLLCSPDKDRGRRRHVLRNRYRRLKNWLRGTHGHGELLQGYLDEFCYRDNRSHVQGGLLKKLIQRMVDRDPCTYQELRRSSA